QSEAGTVDARLHRSLRNSQDLGDVLVGLTFDVVEHDRQTQLVRQLLQRFLHADLNLGAVRGVFGVARRDVDLCARGVALSELDLSRARTTEAAASVQRSVGRDPVEEGREPRLTAETVTVGVEAEEGLLRGILGLFAAAEHAIEQPEDVALVVADEALERV